jgi:hypothetical protein
MGKPGKTWAEIVEIGNMVGGLEHGFYDFLYLENVIIPTGPKSILFRRGRRKTTNQIYKFLFKQSSGYIIPSYNHI